MKLLTATLLYTLCAQAWGEIVVFTSRKEHLIKDIFKKFEKQTNIKVKYRTGKAGELIHAIKTQGSNSGADILMTVDAGNLWYAADQGILEPINSKVLQTNVPAHLRDSRDRWFGLSMRARTIAYNPRMITPDKLKSYAALSKPDFKGKLCLRTSKKVYNQSLVAMLISEHGEKEAKAIVKGWVDNAVEIFSSDTNVLKAIASGQCAVGIVNTYYYGRLMRDNPDHSLKLHWPNQANSYGVHVNVSGAGLVKGTKNKDEARKLLEWLSSSSAQGEFAAVNLEYPVKEGVSWDPTVKKWGTFQANTTFQLTKAGELQKSAIKLMYEANYK